MQPINIFRPIRMSKETFHPLSYNQDEFVMNWSLEGGGMVPPHYHRHMDENFTVTEGEVTFTVGDEKVVKTAGDTLLVPKGVVHSIKNATKGNIALHVRYTPCSDTHRMFVIIASLDEEKPNSIMNMMKFLYLAPQLGLKDFSSPQPPVAWSIIMAMVNVMGTLGGWKKLLPRFSNI